MPSPPSLARALSLPLSHRFLSAKSRMPRRSSTKNDQF
jgi:hypothetical protein